MRALFSSMPTVLLWHAILPYYSPILASPTILRELAPRQPVVSSASSTNVAPIVAGIMSAINDINSARNKSSPSSNSIVSTTSSEPSSGDSTTVPIDNSPILFPTLSSKCTSGDQGTATFSTEFAHHTGFEILASGQEFWNATGAVWVVKVISPGYSLQQFGFFGGEGAIFDVAEVDAISTDSASSTFALTVPTHACEISRPALSWSVNPTQTTTEVASTYTLGISGEYPCASNTILNPPECTHNPAYALTIENWQAQNVDQFLYQWWFDSRDYYCDPLALGSSTLKKVKPPDTLGNMPAQLAYWAANLEAFDCTMAGSSCTISANPCDSAGIPPWAFLALSAMMNLHATLDQIYTALVNAILSNSLLSYTVLDAFIEVPVTPDEKANLALTFIGAIVGVFGLFWTLAIPAKEVAAVVGEAAKGAVKAEGAAAGAAAKGAGSAAGSVAEGVTEEVAADLPLAIQAVERIGSGLTSPKVVPGQSAAIYGSIPGTLITAAGSSWAKIVGNTADPLGGIRTYSDLLEANFNQTQHTLFSYNDNLFGNNSWSAMLMVALYGGIYAKNHTEWSASDLIDAMNVDVTSRMINNIWGQSQVYVQFTDLGDGNSTKNCTADLHGPQSSKYCADGGVYYLQSLGFTGADAWAVPNTQEPYGYASLTSVGIEPWWICAASAKVYRQHGLNLDYTDADAFTSSLSTMIATNLANSKSLIGQLPGEWSLPVCDGGKNYYGWDYTNAHRNASSGGQTDAQVQGSVRSHQWVPCACGPRGNETSLFYQAANIWNLSWAQQTRVRDSCGRTMAYNNNQGFLGIGGGGPPASGIINYSGSHDSLQIAYEQKPEPPAVFDPPWYV